MGRSEGVLVHEYFYCVVEGHGGKNGITEMITVCSRVIICTIVTYYTLVYIPYHYYLRVHFMSIYYDRNYVIGFWY